MTRPGTPTLVFDADCGVCTRLAGFARQRLPDDAEVIGWQFVDDLDALGLDLDDVAASSWWISADGTRRGGAAGVASALRSMSGPWSVLGRTLELPGIRQAATALYPVIARHRHRLPGASDSCRIPSE